MDARWNDPAARDRYKAFYEKARDIVLFIRPQDGRVLDANRAAVDAYGYSYDELVSLTVYDLRAGDRHNLIDAQMAQAGSGGILFEAVHHRKDGTTFPVEVSSQGLEIKGERILLSIVRDTTTRKAVEEALRRERDFSATVVDTVDSLVLVLDPYGRIVRFNRACERLTGYSYSEVKGRPVWDFLPVPEEVMAARAVFENLRAGLAPGPLENHWLRKDGRPRFVAWSHTPLRGAGGAVEHVVATGTDVTEDRRHRRIQSLLTEAAEKLVGQPTAGDIARTAVEQGMAILEADSAAVWVADNDRRALRLLASRNLTRESEDVLRFIPFDSDLPAAVAARTRRVQLVENYTAAAGGNPVLAEVLRRDGVNSLLVLPLHTRHALMGVISYRGKRREPLTPFERHTAEILAGMLAVALERARLIDDLRDAVRVRERFLDLAAHELKTPLTTFAGYVQLLSRRGGHDPEEDRIYKVLKTQCNRMSRLVQTMLDVSRLQAGQFDLVRQSVDLCLLAKQTAEIVQAETSLHQLEVHCETSAVASADPERIRTALYNLLDNAVKYSPQGGPIHVRVRSEGGEATISVSDSGLGIPRDKQTQLFRAFFQVAPMVRPTMGMGLGLYVSREIVLRHGGRIWLESEEGKGSAIYVSLPVYEPL